MMLIAKQISNLINGPLQYLTFLPATIFFPFFNNGFDIKAHLIFVSTHHQPPVGRYSANSDYNAYRLTKFKHYRWSQPVFLLSLNRNEIIKCKSCKYSCTSDGKDQGL